MERRLSRRYKQIQSVGWKHQHHGVNTMLQLSEIRRFAHFAGRLADETGAILRTHRITTHGGMQTFETKGDLSPVTELDRRLEMRMREMIETEFPAHGVLGEEFAPKDIDAEFVWVLDPIDGTKQFIAGVPVYGTLISLACDGKPIVGVIDHPITNERWAGAAGMHSTLNGKDISTRACPQLADALMSCSSAETIGPAQQAGFERLRQATKWRLYGAACYAHARLASGQVDISADSGGHREVDYCALVPVIEGAGGVMDWDGSPLTIRTVNSILAAGDPARHREALRLLQGA